MKRALIVVLIAVLIAAVSGISDSSLALAQQSGPAGDAHQRQIAARVNAIGVNHVVRIERMDGSESDALIEDVMPDSITVLLLAGPDRQRETIPFAQIKKVDEVRGHKLRNVLIGLGVAVAVVAVLVGTCAASSNPDVSPAATDR